MLIRIIAWEENLRFLSNFALGKVKELPWFRQLKLLIICFHCLLCSAKILYYLSPLIFNCLNLFGFSLWNLIFLYIGVEVADFFIKTLRKIKDKTSFGKGNVRGRSDSDGCWCPCQIYIWILGQKLGLSRNTQEQIHYYMPGVGNGNPLQYS